MTGTSRAGCAERATEGSLLGKRIRERIADFSAVYMHVTELRQWLRDGRRRVGSEMVEILVSVLDEPTHRSQKQVFFLHREAAGVLAELIGDPGLPVEVRALALSRLKRLAASSVQSVHRAACEALGSLPLDIRGPLISPNGDGEVSRLGGWELSRALASQGCGPPYRVGRSFVSSGTDSSFVVSIKVWQGPDAHTAAVREWTWMELLNRVKPSIPKRFDIPEPLLAATTPVFQLTSFPDACGNETPLAENRCILFRAPRDYYRYPNGSAVSRLLDESEFLEVILRNAWLFGKTASMGIVHTAPIPLFHNRTQVDRRNDGGIYQWPRGGRLDRWLESCRHPNFGISGLRDFEHLRSLRTAGDGRGFYQDIGTQILSLVLVAGSYFRGKAPQRVGLDSRGKPVDARDLFHRPLLEDLLHGIYREYHRGLVGAPPREPVPLDVSHLAERMIEEMGVDRHMEEIFRVADQERMSQAEFEGFLAERGCSRQEIGRRLKGAEDIALQTGPHLGRFNGPISLPEMLRFVAVTAAGCIADRFMRSNLCP